MSDRRNFLKGLSMLTLSGLASTQMTAASSTEKQML